MMDVLIAIDVLIFLSGTVLGFSLGAMAFEKWGKR